MRSALSLSSALSSWLRPPASAGTQGAAGSVHAVECRAPPAPQACVPLRRICTPPRRLSLKVLALRRDLYSTSSVDLRCVPARGRSRAQHQVCGAHTTARGPSGASPPILHADRHRASARGAGGTLAARPSAHLVVGVLARLHHVLHRALDLAAHDAELGARALQLERVGLLARGGTGGRAASWPPATRLGGGQLAASLLLRHLAALPRALLASLAGQRFLARIAPSPLRSRAVSASMAAQAYVASVTQALNDALCLQPFPSPKMERCSVPQVKGVRQSSTCQALGAVRRVA